MTGESDGSGAGTYRDAATLDSVETSSASVAGALDSAARPPPGVVADGDGDSETIVGTGAETAAAGGDDVPVPAPPPPGPPEEDGAESVGDFPEVC